MPRPPRSALVCLLAGVTACSSSVPSGPARSYPAHLPRGPVLDIHVFLEPDRLRLTNTTTTSFEHATLWLNAWFSAPIDRFHVGQTLSVPLKQFRDEHGEAFRGGGFFATEPPDRLVLAELETTWQDQPTLLRLIVIRSPPG